MTNYIIDNHDVSKLFDDKYPLIKFSDNPNDHIPTYGSIIYTIWDKEKKFIYVGIGGLGQSPNTPLSKRNPRSRIFQHKSGRRSGDQFCIYIHDYYIVPQLNFSKYKFKKGYLDKLTKNFINENLSYRFCVFQKNDSIEIVRSLEKKIQQGIFGIKPLLNSE